MSFDPVTLEHWRAVEVFVDGQWCNFETLLSQPNN
jgi:hypothetical protein